MVSETMKRGKIEIWAVAISKNKEKIQTVKTRTLELRDGLKVIQKAKGKKNCMLKDKYNVYYYYELIREEREREKTSPSQQNGTVQS